jgi:hypothetical protein
MMWKEAVITYRREMSQHLPGRTENIIKGTSWAPGCNSRANDTGADCLLQSECGEVSTAGSRTQFQHLISTCGLCIFSVPFLNPNETAIFIGPDVSI